MSSDPPQPTHEGPTTLRIAAVLLAAGASTRMGAFKQLLPYGSSTIVETCVDTLLRSKADATLVVTGHRAADVSAAIADRPVRVVENTRYLDGMSSSVKTAVEAVGDSFDAIMICLCDQPHLPVAVFDTVIDAYRTTRGVIVVPQIAGDTGHPAIFDLRLRDEILGLDEAQGLRSVTYAHRADIVRVAVDDVGVLDDMDTPDDYARLR